MRDLAIGLIQYPIVWSNPKQNRALLEQLIAQLDPQTNLVILPEMFTTGFTMNPETVFEDSNDNCVTLDWMRELASERNMAITGSFVVREDQGFYNRLYFVHPDGEYQQYDKRHLFRMANEHQHYCAGNRKLILEYLGWRICPMICYDLRFPVWSRNRNNYDLLIYVANWPATRKQHWQTLLKARAIENLCYVAGVNRTGIDGNGVSYDGNSALFDAQGQTMVNTEQETACCQQTLRYADLSDYRKKFPAFMDADDFDMEVS